MSAGGQRIGCWLARLVGCSLWTFVAAPAAAEQDVQSWLEVDLSHRLSRRWEVAFEQHLRLDENVSRVAQIMPDLSVQAKLRSGLQAIAGYRLQYVRDGSGDLEFRHRLYAGGQGKLDLDELRLTARALFTEQLREDGEWRHGERTRLAAAWRGLGRWQPKLSAELFVAFSDPDAVAIDKWRLGIDLERKLRKASVAVGYRWEGADRDEDALVAHALLLSYGFEL